MEIIPNPDCDSQPCCGAPNWTEPTRKYSERCRKLNLPMCDRAAHCRRAAEADSKFREELRDRYAAAGIERE